MNVILVGVDGFENDVGMMLRPRLEKFFEVALNALVEDVTSVFGRPDQVIITRKYAVAHSAILGHVYSIRNFS